MEVEGDEGGVEADHPAQVHLLRGGPEGGGGDGGAGLAAARNVVTDQVEGVDGATGEVCQTVRKIIIVWTRNFLDVSQQQHYTEYYHSWAKISRLKLKLEIVLSFTVRGQGEREREN